MANTPKHKLRLIKNHIRAARLGVDDLGDNWGDNLDIVSHLPELAVVSAECDDLEQLLDSILLALDENA